MRYLVFSDLHGAEDPLNKIINIYRNDHFDKVIILGDILYHGPRNDLPSSYNPKQCVKLIKETFGKNYIWIQGNCDAEVDEMVLENSYKKRCTIKVSDKKILLTHGHHISRFSPYTKNDGINIVLYGHYHVFDISKIDGITYINVGSTSIPKDGMAQYAIIDEKEIKVLNLNTNEVIGSYQYEN